MAHLSEREAIDFLLHELPEPRSKSLDVADEADSDDSFDPRNGHSTNRASSSRRDGEHTPLLSPRSTRPRAPTTPNGLSHFGTDQVDGGTWLAEDVDTFASEFANLNALEIAAVAGAKKFMNQRAIQRIVYGIWRGDIVFWDTLSVHSKKQAKFYNKRRADPYCRLRVPRYLKAFEVLFFATFLALYYAVLAQKHVDTVGAEEVLLYIWIAGFAYDEFGEIKDAGQTSFYTVDFWSIWDIGIVAIGCTFCVLRKLASSLSQRRPLAPP